MAQITQDVKGKLKLQSAYIEAPFYKTKEVLEKEGYRVISLEENAILRILEGKYTFISKNGNYAREGVIYIPKKGKFLTKNSPIMNNAEKATQCHKDGKEFYLNKEQVKKALEKSVKLDKSQILTSEFGNEEITDFAFGKYAKEYGKFLKDAEINEMPIWTANLENKPFARQLWFWGLDGRSGLNGNWDLDDINGVRGVRDGVRKAQQKTESYTPQQIQMEKQMEEALTELRYPENAKKSIIEKLRSQYSD